jgi:hypothetical protein
MAMLDGSSPGANGLRDSTVSAAGSRSRPKANRALALMETAQLSCIADLRLTI